MKKILSGLLAAVMALSCFTVLSYAIPIPGKTYYVDNVSGSDNNDGSSPLTAFQTITKAGSLTYSPGDTLLFKRGGVFAGGFSAHGSGTEEYPITVGAYGSGDEKPLLTTLENITVFTVSDVQNWVVKDLEITAPTGNAVLICFSNAVTKNITLDNIVMHDVNNYASDTYYSGSRAALRIMGSNQTSGAHAENITVKNCEIYDCGYGIFTGGNFPNTAERPYNKNIVVDSCSIHNLYDDAFIMSCTDTIILRNSSVIDACQSAGVYYTAPVWMWGVTNALVECCEIAGSKNYMDGMVVDFDDHTDHSTYQYVYSHDNICFMWNCPYDADDHYNNTVRYCLSVNDNQRTNAGSNSGKPEHNFKFYNNTIINGSSYNFTRYDETCIQNNIFRLKEGHYLKFSEDYTYYLSNNCYDNTAVPLSDAKSLFANPQFAGGDVYDINSYVLKKGSPCIAAGTQVEEYMGERDFYNNALTDTHNIGCYEGSGVDGKIVDTATINDFFDTNLAVILNKIIELINHDLGWLGKQLGTEFPLLDNPYE